MATRATDRSGRRRRRWIRLAWAAAAMLLLLPYLALWTIRATGGGEEIELTRNEVVSGQRR